MRVPCEMNKPLTCLREQLIARERAVGCSLCYYTLIDVELVDNGKQDGRRVKIYSG